MTPTPGACRHPGDRDFTVKTVQKAADIAVQVGSRLYTDSASSYRALTGYEHEYVNHRTGCEFSRVPTLRTLAIVEAKSGSLV